MADDALIEELLKREPVPSKLAVFDSRIPQDFAIQSALMKLRELGRTGLILPRLAAYEDLPTSKDKRAAVGRPVGWVRSDDADPKKVFVANYGDDYKSARGGNQNAMKRLAAIIAHEDFHNRKGFAEVPAYQEQIDVLKQLKAPRGDVLRIQDVQRHFSR